MDDSDLKPKRTFRVAKAPEIKIPDIQDIFDDAISVLANEVKELKIKSIKKHNRLDAGEATRLQKYIKSIVDLSREVRERDKLDEDLGDLSDEEIMKKYEAAQSKVNEKRRKEN